MESHVNGHSTSDLAQPISIHRINAIKNNWPFETKVSCLNCTSVNLLIAILYFRHTHLENVQVLYWLLSVHLLVNGPVNT